MNRFLLVLFVMFFALSAEAVNSNSIAAMPALFKVGLGSTTTTLLLESDGEGRALEALGINGAYSEKAVQNASQLHDMRMHRDECLIVDKDILKKYGKLWRKHPSVSDTSGLVFASKAVALLLSIACLEAVYKNQVA